MIAGWSSLVARWAHIPEVAGSNPAPAMNFAGVAQSVRAPDCRSGGCGFESRRPRLICFFGLMCYNNGEEEKELM